MKIAYGNSRMEKKWKNNEISWEDFCKRVSTTQTTTETVDEYRKMSNHHILQGKTGERRVPSGICSLCKSSHPSGQDRRKASSFRHLLLMDM